MAARLDTDWSGAGTRFDRAPAGYPRGSRAPGPFQRPPVSSVPVSSISGASLPVVSAPVASLPAERRHVADGFVVEIRLGPPSASLGNMGERNRHRLTCSIPSLRPGPAAVAQPAAEMAFLPAGHAGTAPDDGGTERHLCLLLQTEFLDEILPGVDAGPGFVARHGLEGERLRHVLDRLAIELETPGFASDMLVQSLCLAAVIELNRCLMAEFAAEARPANACQDRVLSLVEHRLRTCLEQPVSLENLAEECGIGVRHLSRIFRQATGTTIGHTLAKARIDQAKRLLSQTSVMIKEVSWRCGFREQAAFTTAFRKATGQSPSAYRGAVRTGPARDRAPG